MGNPKVLKSKILNQLRAIDLIDFIQLVEYKMVTRDEIRNEKISFTRHPRIFGESSLDTELFNWEPEEFQHVLVNLYPIGFTKYNRIDIIRYFLLDQSRMSDISNSNLNEAIYEAIKEHEYTYGTPTHLVRIATRLWMVANPNDFIIFLNREESKLGLFIKDDKRTKIYSIHRGNPKTFRMLGQN